MCVSCMETSTFPTDYHLKGTNLTVEDVKDVPGVIFVSYPRSVDRFACVSWEGATLLEKEIPRLAAAKAASLKPVKRESNRLKEKTNRSRQGDDGVQEPFFSMDIVNNMMRAIFPDSDEDTFGEDDFDTDSEIGVYNTKSIIHSGMVVLEYFSFLSVANYSFLDYKNCKAYRAVRCNLCHDDSKHQITAILVSSEMFFILTSSSPNATL
jgi:hypothetical protein